MQDAFWCIAPHESEPLSLARLWGLWSDGGRGPLGQGAGAWVLRAFLHDELSGAVVESAILA
eukprot:8568957-Lingulodinium_polyedra.AAC.1